MVGACGELSRERNGACHASSDCYCFDCICRRRWAIRSASGPPTTSRPISRRCAGQIPISRLRHATRTGAASMPAGRPATAPPTWILPRRAAPSTHSDPNVSFTSAVRLGIELGQSRHRHRQGADLRRLSSATTGNLTISSSVSRPTTATPACSARQSPRAATPLRRRYRAAPRPLRSVTAMTTTRRSLPPHRCASRTTATARLRAGWVVDNVLPYAMVGLAVGRAEISRYATATGTPVNPPGTAYAVHQNRGHINSSMLTWGYSAGLGADWSDFPRRLRAGRIRVREVHAGVRFSIADPQRPSRAWA